MVDLTKYLLHKGLPYVLLGEMQSDPLEKEFGVYRQLTGGNYYMSLNNVFNSLKLQRIKLFNSLNIQEKIWHAEMDCCIQPLNHDELRLLDDCFDLPSNLSEIERSSVYYIAGYVCFKENIRCYEQLDCPESEFAGEVSRGRLSHPTLEIFDLGLYLYSYYKHTDDKNCRNRLMKAFEKIYEAIYFPIDNFRSFLKRFANCFANGFSKKVNEDLKASKRIGNAIKRKRFDN